MNKATSTKVEGGSFLLNDGPDLEGILIPEEFTEEQQMIIKTTEEFLNREIISLGEETQKLNYELTKKIVKKAGDVGLLGANLPEEYGGLGLDGVRFALIKEKLNLTASSMTATIGGQMGIGMLPIVFFGTSEQREKYLPALQEGRMTTAFALTEPQSGTDASSIKTTALLSEDGKYYILNGNKVFITNAGFADIFVVFAKINGKDFSAFIVERDTEGLSIGPEEKKMGLKASSTCSLTFEDVKVPVENMLGKPGEGHRFAFNTLNFGRLSVGAGCLGNCKHALECSVKYANERVQFGQKISSFPLIGKKLADMNIKIFALESMVYRTAGVFDGKLKEIDFMDPDLLETSRKAIGEYMVECAINKVFGSEILDFVADEGLQIHGGYGYMQEYEIEGIYRDARIKRIFEGTNEINRMFITKNLVKRLLNGKFTELQAELDSCEEKLKQNNTLLQFENVLDCETQLLEKARTIYHFVLSQAIQKYQHSIEDEQEICSDLGDMAIQIYAIESTLQRTKKLINAKGKDRAKNAIKMAIAFINEAFTGIIGFAESILTVVIDGEQLINQLALVNRYAQKQPVNTVALKREIAARVIEAEKYIV